MPPRGLPFVCLDAGPETAAGRGVRDAMLGSMENVLYFAYGSNLDSKQMKERCPSARAKGVAKRPGHRLAFTRRSGYRRCAVADAVPGPECEVWGAVYEITPEDLAALDGCESYAPGRKGNACERRQCEVWLEGDPQHPVTAEVYFANPTPDPGLPSLEYRQQILDGARDWRLPQAYFEGALERIQAE